MCMMILKKQGNRRLPPISQLVRSWKTNSCGAGIMFSKKGDKSVRFVKGLMTFDAFIKAYESAPFWDAPEDYAVALHFRMATHGGRGQGECHPFPLWYVSDKDLTTLCGEYNEMVMHNGVIQNVDSKITAEQSADKFSDTMAYVNNVLTKEYCTPEDRENLNGKIGYNKLIFMGPDAHSQIVNEQLGQTTEDGIWYSNKL